MTLISRNDDQPLAALYNNILLLKDGTILGVILGHCVFGWQGEVVAKYFNKKLYTLDGLILGKACGSADRPDTDIPELLEKAWALVKQIKDHTCPMIKPTEKWATAGPLEHFLVSL